MNSRTISDIEPIERQCVYEATSRVTAHADTQILVYTVQAKPKNRRQVYEVFKAD